jgi:hemolysin activation/secretion protein
LALRYDVSWHDPLGSGAAGLGLSANLWDSPLNETTSFGTYLHTNKTTKVVTTNTTSVAEIPASKAFQTIAGSKKATGHWVALTPSFTHTAQVVTNWVTTIHADGQWSSEPLISNEQFGAGGVNSVRGYQEGEVFGDAGWRVSFEQQTPPHVVGMINGHIPVVLRGTVYMDYARVYLLDAQGRPPVVALWGTGAGFVASIGSWWQARLLFSVPLLSTSITTAYRPFVNFALTGQF